MTLGEEALKVAKENLGQKEATGHNDGPFVKRIQDWIGDWMEGQPWCAAYATWCIHEAAKRLGLGPSVPFMPKSASSTQIFHWLHAHGKLLPRPEPGCIGLIRGGQSDGKDHDHTFIVDSVDGLYVNSVDGNWGNAVSSARHLIGACDFGLIV